MIPNKTPFMFAAALATATVTAPPGARAADDAAYFDGKTVTYIVATGAGGGFDF